METSIRSASGLNSKSSSPPPVRFAPRSRQQPKSNAPWQLVSVPHEVETVRLNSPTSRLPFDGASSHPLAEDVWDVLERFGGDIARCEKNVRQRLTLEAVRDSIKADAVYW